MGQVLKGARLERWWSRESLSDRLGIEGGTLELIESGAFDPGDELMERIVTWLDEDEHY